MLLSAMTPVIAEPTKGRGSSPTHLTNRQRFHNACHSRKVDHPPIWMMRQAGRVLPEYRALKESSSFLELVRTPELAVEVTLQPIRRFDFDAAILFSDILVIPEALGQNYWFRETGGVQMEYALRSRAEIDRLNTEDVCDRLSYVSETLQQLRRELGDRTALLGFAGSPWTLANFMLEGGSSREPTRGLQLLRENPEDFHYLMETLTGAIIEFLQMQIDCGIDALQIFDSHGGLLSEADFFEGSGRWIEQIISALPPAVPVIVFSKGTRDWKGLANTGARVVGVDQHTTLMEARRNLPHELALQGNLDPRFLVEGNPAFLERETNRILHQMRDRAGYIFNLGHGVPPAADLENIEAVINTVRSYQ